MIVKLNLEPIRTTTWSEYATRFVFGGAVTLLAGLIAEKFGPGVGGLFLAFPAIFPAGASLIEKQQRRKKRQAGVNGEVRGRLAAGVDAAGAAIGCSGLAGFAISTWKFLPQLSLWQTLILATGIWTSVAVTMWIFCRRGPKRRIPEGKRT